MIHEGGQGTGKAIPIEDWAGLEGFKRIRLPDLETVGT
jgi:hypothetical protein